MATKKNVVATRGANAQTRAYEANHRSKTWHEAYLSERELGGRRQQTPREVAAADSGLRANFRRAELDAQQERSIIDAQNARTIARRRAELGAAKKVTPKKKK